MNIAELYYKENTQSIFGGIKALTFTETSVSQTESSTRPFRVISNLFNFSSDQIIVVIRAGVLNNEKIEQRLLNAINQIENKKHLNFFIEDLFTTIEDPPELSFVKGIADFFNLPYTIYHCEKNNRTKYFDWYLVHCVTGIRDELPVTLEFSKKICCLNRRYSDYRYLASAFLSNYSDDVYLTQHYSLDNVAECKIDLNKLDPRLGINRGLEILRKGNQYRDFTTPVDVDYTSTTATSDLLKITQDSFCSLVTESKFHSDMPNFSEKTLRAMIAGRPFILLAPKGTLKLIKDLGFITFDKFWDESYDDIDDPTERFQRALYTAKTILEKKNLSIEPLKPILEFNQQQVRSIPRRMFELLKN